MAAYLLKTGTIFAACALVAVAVFVSCAYFRKGGGEPDGGEYRSPNFRDGVFLNPVPTTVTMDGKTMNTLWRWISITDGRTPGSALSFRNASIREQMEAPGDLKIAWVGHSSVLMKIDGKIFLTDPMWGRRASPLSFMGPARFFEPPFSLDELPRLDGVIISHDHYDHLDRDTIERLGATGVMFYAPLGVGAILRSWGVAAENVAEFDWWQERALGEGHRLVAVPARHFSGRGLRSRNSTLWTAWVVAGGAHRVFFGGDGGYFEGFAEIGAKYGPFDLVMLETGAYDRNWPAIHMGPVNAVRAHLDLKGRVLMPIHWGTFNLALHAWTEPVETLVASAREQAVALCLPRPGQVVQGDSLAVDSRWWGTD